MADSLLEVLARNLTDEDDDSSSSSSSSSASTDIIKSVGLDGFAATLTLLMLSGVVAVLAGVEAGGPVANSIIEVFGVEGEARGLWLIGIVLALSLALEIYGLEVTAPFWVGLVVMLLILTRFVLPGFITDPFGALNLGQIIFGIPISEMNVARVAVLGLSFILLYYALLVRLRYTFGKPGGAGNVSGVASLTRSNLRSLLREYRDLLIGIGALGATIFTYMNLAVAQGIGEAFYQLFGEGAAIAFGYVASIALWAVNTFTNVLPFTLGPEALAAIFGLVFVASFLRYITEYTTR